MPSENSEINDLINTFIFKDDDFCGVMNTSEEFDNFGMETSIRVKYYYLVNPAFAKDLILKIWA